MATAKNKKSILSTILKLLYYIVIVFVCLIAIFLIYYIINSQLHADDENYKPKFSIYTIVSPSMTPVINVYDIVINIRPETPKDIQVGDIINKVDLISSEMILHKCDELFRLIFVNELSKNDIGYDGKLKFDYNCIINKDIEKLSKEPLEKYNEQ